MNCLLLMHFDIFVFNLLGFFMINNIISILYYLHIKLNNKMHELIIFLHQLLFLQNL